MEYTYHSTFGAPQQAVTQKPRGYWSAVIAGLGLTQLIGTAAVVGVVGTAAVVGIVSGLTEGSLASVIHSGESRARGWNDWNNCPSSGKCLSNSASIYLTSMTVGELLDRQERRGTPGGLFALGMWQITPAPLQEAVELGVVRRSDLFSIETQNRIFAVHLAGAKRPAIKSYITNGNGLKDAADAAAWEWAALKSPFTGKGHYDKVGRNNASIDAAVVMGALQQAHKNYEQTLSTGLDPDTAYQVAIGVATTI